MNVSDVFAIASFLFNIFLCCAIWTIHFISKSLNEVNDEVITLQGEIIEKQYEKIALLEDSLKVKEASL